MKKIFVLFLLLSFCSSSNEEAEVQIDTTTTIGVEMSDKVYDKKPEMNINTDSNYTAVIKTNLGDMTVEFFTDDSPMTVNNFISLSKDGYYDNVIFHRVISGFMIQGGDPSGTGHGDYGKYPGYEFEDELNNQRPYEKGILAMANRGPNTNGSQFFITTQKAHWLDGKHVVFGLVLKGFDIVKKIEDLQTDGGDKPLQEVLIKECGLIKIDVPIENNDNSVEV